MLDKTRKVKIVENLKNDLENARAVFLTNLIGVGSNDANEIRKGIRESGGKVVIARNTLLSKAAVGTTAEKMLKELKGPNAVALAFEDAPGVAKVLYEKSKDFESIDFKGGLLGEKELTINEIKELAMLPGRDQMLATLLATFNAPVSAFVRTLDAIRRKKEEEGGAQEA